MMDEKKSGRIRIPPPILLQTYRYNGHTNRQANRQTNTFSLYIKIRQNKTEKKGVNGVTSTG